MYFIEFVLTTDTFWYWPGFETRKARIRSLTYSVTLSLNSIPIIRVSGKRVARLIKSPPNPHPISANSTFFELDWESGDGKK
ncbi:hypothetical protein HanIR_Chr14g0695471 [Helianthus annuus]|nr:hypothetical protein HanIR_Chr14g0695471 [Helianthus annuus]